MIDILHISPLFRHQITDIQYSLLFYKYLSKITKKQASLPAQIYVCKLIYFFSTNGFPIGSTVLPAKSLIMIPAIIYHALSAQNISS